jgi:hypothetical protein
MSLEYTSPYRQRLLARRDPVGRARPMLATAVAACAMMLAMTGPARAADAQPADLPPGALVVRDGPANVAGGYAGEDRDAAGRLLRVSALCTPALAARQRANGNALLSTDKTRPWKPWFGTYGTAQAGAIESLGGHVVADPLPDSPNHCLISGLTADDMTRVWTMCGLNPGEC